MLRQIFRDRLHGHPMRIALVVLFVILIALLIADLIWRALDHDTPHSYVIASLTSGPWPLNTMGYQFHGGPGMWKISNSSGVRVQVAFGSVHTAKGYLAQACGLHPGIQEKWTWVPHTQHQKARTTIGQCDLELSRVASSS